MTAALLIVFAVLLLGALLGNLHAPQVLHDIERELPFVPLHLTTVTIPPPSGRIESQRRLQALYDTGDDRPCFFLPVFMNFTKFGHVARFEHAWPSLLTAPPQPNIWEAYERCPQPNIWEAYER